LEEKLMHEKDIQLLEESFKKYYFDHFDLIHVPEKPEQREFGFQKFAGGMNRHISIKDDKELHLFLRNKIPSDVYCSNACYSFPNLPMSEKDWKGADLIFDIDAKDLNLDSRKKHSIIKCTSCNKISKLQDSCPHCNSQKLSSITLTCKDCIDATKDEVKKLTDILSNDFNIEEESIKIYFSGNEGFHIYVLNSQYDRAESKERSELADYLMFRGAIPDRFGFGKSSFPELNDKGWKGRVSKQIFGSESKRKKVIKEILSKGDSSFQVLLEKLKDTIGVKIDPNVTMDIHRIFRLPGSINSKSGLTKLYCESLDEFDPYKMACFIDDEPIEITANTPIKFELKNKEFGPYENEKIELPRFAAVYMICKGIGTLSA